MKLTSFLALFSTSGATRWLSWAGVGGLPSARALSSGDIPVGEALVSWFPQRETLVRRTECSGVFQIPSSPPSCWKEAEGDSFSDCSLREPGRAPGGKTRSAVGPL